MNYDGFIDRVNDKVRTDDEWPTSANVTQEQVDISFVAALAVMATLPLSAFSSSGFSNGALTGGTDVYERLTRYDMPADVFRYRDDLGINSIELDGFEYQLSEAIPLSLLRSKAKNVLYKDSVLFSANAEKRRVHTFSVDVAKLNYLAEPSKPAPADIGTTAFPIDGTQAEQAASIAAAHVLGELKRDTAAAQFQAILERSYDTNREPQPQPQPQGQS